MENREDYVAVTPVAILGVPRHALFVIILSFEEEDKVKYIRLVVGSPEARIMMLYGWILTQPERRAEFLSRPATIDLLCEVIEAFAVERGQPGSITITALKIEDAVTVGESGDIVYVGKMELELDTGKTVIQSELDARPSDLMAIHMRDKAWGKDCPGTSCVLLKRSVLATMDVFENLDAVQSNTPEPDEMIFLGPTSEE